MAIKIVTEEDLEKIERIIRVLIKEINDLKDKKAHKMSCGCTECDDRGRCLAQIFSQDNKK